MILSFTEFLLLIFALSLDTYTAGISYSMGKVRVSFLSLLLISAVSGFMLTLSFTMGKFIIPFIPSSYLKFFSFFLLFLLALYKLYDAFSEKLTSPGPLTTNSISRKVNTKDLHILSPREAIYLSLLLSIDSLSAGIGSMAPLIPVILIFLLSAFMHFCALYLGLITGRFISYKSSSNFSFLSAILLFLLAFFRLL
ncbi:MAG: manganese efflux pump [Lachnospiraceae bacterium]|nr:manganese efflux pump [Lachnospiraceae bacterium]